MNGSGPSLDDAVLGVPTEDAHTLLHPPYHLPSNGISMPMCTASESQLPSSFINAEIGHAAQQVSSSSASGSEAYFPQDLSASVADYLSGYPLPPVLNFQPAQDCSQGRLALPQEFVGEETVFVNAKQYHCILRRRAQRARADAQNKLLKVRKPYLHKSRHEHANKRVRGPHGRFLTAEERTAMTAQHSSEPNPIRPPALQDISQDDLVRQKSHQDAGREG